MSLNATYLHAEYQLRIYVFYLVHNVLLNSFKESTEVIPLIMVTWSIMMNMNCNMLSFNLTISLSVDSGEQLLKYKISMSSQCLAWPTVLQDIFQDVS